ncbi:MAG: type IVB secretion system protein IcmH/DotU [Methylococcales bacterium]|nr:type IVB secretion system protein IcmH/DotU [Methylococcales bacterium]
MNKDDPFGNSYIDDDKTILRPMPGGGRRSQAQVPPVSAPSAAQPADGKTGSTDDLHLVGENAGNNPFIGAAMALLSLVAQLRNTAIHADVAGLRAGIIEEVKRFDSKIRTQNIPGDQAQAARYALCTLLDETVLNTPWGCNSIWSTQSLLIYFHKEAVGGEKFFLILKNCLQQPGSHLDLLELLYFCLCLGFEGRYRNEDHGLSKLEEIRENAYQTLQRQRGDVDRELSLHWQGTKDKRNVLARLVPLWVIASVAALVLMLSFIGFLYGVNTAANPVLSRIYLLKDSFDVPPPAAVGVAPASEPVAVDQAGDIRGFLKPEVDSGQVAILNRNGKTVVRIMSNGFFASASDKIKIQYYPLLDKISQALSKITERITIVGHTDSDQIISAKFPSNWELSKARAISVAEVLINNNKITATLVTEGRADTQPMVANDSPGHKAMNRRVEIIF